MRTNHQPEDDLFLVYPPEVLEKMWKQVFPVLEDKSVGKPIITGTSGGIGGINLEEFYNYERD